MKYQENVNVLKQHHSLQKDNVFHVIFLDILILQVRNAYNVLLDNNFQQNN